MFALETPHDLQTDSDVNLSSSHNTHCTLASLSQLEQTYQSSVHVQTRLLAHLMYLALMLPTHQHIGEIFSQITAYMAVKLGLNAHMLYDTIRLHICHILHFCTHWHAAVLMSGSTQKKLTEMVFLKKVGL